MPLSIPAPVTPAKHRSGQSPTELKTFTTALAEATADGKGNRREALEDLFWAVLTSKEFLFNR
jgi:hypothetical protein